MRQNGSKQQSVAIVGAGIAGLAVAWRLAQAGAAVTVFERGRAGRGASHAAAGMLAGGVEIEPGEEGLYPLSRRAQALWPDFAAELAAAAGLPPAALGYRGEGTLVVARTADELRRLEQRARLQAGLGVALERLESAALRQLEGHLSADLLAGYLSRADHQVENRALAPALVDALRAAGGCLREEAPVAALLCRNGAAAGVALEDGSEVAADAVVLAAGAWIGRLAGVPADCRPPVRPVKGQMLALAMDPARPLLRHVLWGPGVYLVPRRDGRLLIGATVEERGFDTQVTAGGVLSLLDAAWRLLPGIEELPLIESWAGLRPTSRDDQPILGPTPLPGLHLAGGQHRNGVLLLPVIAEALLASVQGRPLPAAAAAFTLARFGLEAAA